MDTDRAGGCKTH